MFPNINHTAEKEDQPIENKTLFLQTGIVSTYSRYQSITHSSDKKMTEYKVTLSFLRMNGINLMQC